MKNSTNVYIKLKDKNCIINPKIGKKFKIYLLLNFQAFFHQKCLFDVQSLVSS